MRIWSIFLVLVLTLSGFNAEAKRMGSNKSFGKQSSNVTQRNAAPTAPGQPAQGASNAAPKQGAGAPATPSRPWGAMLGGLAAGLGLAWLASSLGLGEGMGQILMFLLLGLVIAMAVGWFMRNRNKSGAAAANRTPFAFQGAGAAQPAPSYRPETVGNDASARPWERNTAAFDSGAPASGGSVIGSGLLGSQSWGIPAGFDAEGFVRSAKTNFINLQAAWDSADISALRAMMTDDMLQEIQSQLSERQAQTGSMLNKTDVVMLEATLLGIEELPHEYMASIEFSGMIREEPSTSPAPFREVWNMTKSKAGGGWLVAGVQALQ
jgi:predicted lipid-binding transport protein (Tim44 family)